MPYCVNCGVKLKSSEKKCPLCNTPVILPTNLPIKEENSAFPPQKEEPGSEFDKDLWIKLISVVTAMPALLTLAIDYLAGNGIGWSLYILYALGLVWVWCVSPFLFKRNIFPLWLSLDSAALILLLFLVEKASDTGNWVLTLAMPIVITVSAIIYLLVSAFQRNIARQLQKPALVFFAIALLVLIIEILIDLYKWGIYQPGWSVLVAIPCIAFGIILLILQRRQWIVEELRHWFRI